MGELAIAAAADGGVGVEHGAGRSGVCGGERQRADLAVDGDRERLLQHARGAGDTVVDGGVEVHEGKRGRQVGAASRTPVAGEIDVAHERIGDGAQLGLELWMGLRGESVAFRPRVVAERDALIGGPAGIERIIAPAALHLEHMGERGGEDIRPARGAALVLGTRHAQAEDAGAGEGGNGDGVGLIAAEEDRARRPATVVARGFRAARHWPLAART